MLANSAPSFILFPQNERFVHSPPLARPSHRAQNPLTRTEQGSTGQTLIRMTKLYCFHTHTQMHGQTKTHTWKIQKQSSVVVSYVIISDSVCITCTQKHRGASLKFTSAQELWQKLLSALFYMTSGQPLTLAASKFRTYFQTVTKVHSEMTLVCSILHLHLCI